MPLSILLSPIKDLSLKKLKHLLTKSTSLAEEIICYKNNLLEIQLLRAIKSLEIAKVIKRSGNPKFEEIYQSIDSARLTSPIVFIKMSNQSKLLRLFVALILSEAFELRVNHKTFAEVVYNNIKIEGEDVGNDSCYKLFAKFIKYPLNQ